MSRTSGPNDLLLAVDRDADLPLRDQIAEQLREAIRSRRLRPGVVLPAGRTLAADLGVSARRGGRGVRGAARAGVRRDAAAVGAASAEGADSPLPAGPDGSPSPRYDLVPELPDLGLFPRRAWSQALQLALRTAPDRAFDYGDPRGDERLRRVLADYLGRARGVVADPEQIVVCQGSIQAVDLACRVVASLGGRSIGLEDPCADGLRRAAPGAGLSFVPIPVDTRGAEVERLAASSADAAIVTPGAPVPQRRHDGGARRGRLLALGASAAASSSRTTTTPSSSTTAARRAPSRGGAGLHRLRRLGIEDAGAGDPAGMGGDAPPAGRPRGGAEGGAGRRVAGPRADRPGPA